MTNRLKVSAIFALSLGVTAYFAHGIGHSTGYRSGLEAGRGEVEEQLVQLENEKADIEHVKAGLSERDETLSRTQEEVEVLQEELTRRLSLLGIVNSGATSESICENLVDECAGTIDSIVSDAVDEAVSERDRECP